MISSAENKFLQALRLVLGYVATCTILALKKFHYTFMSCTNLNWLSVSIPLLETKNHLSVYIWTLN